MLDNSTWEVVLYAHHMATDQLIPGKSFGVQMDGISYGMEISQIFVSNQPEGTNNPANILSWMCYYLSWISTEWNRVSQIWQPIDTKSPIVP